MTDVYHVPALLPQVIEGLDIKPGGTYVDVTYGGGGHSNAILSLLDDNGHLYSFDQDADAVERAPKNEPRFTIVHGNFRFLENFLRYYGVEKGCVDGILGDLGVSFHHFDDADRGFSFRFSGPLDMRMNRRSPRTAASILASMTEQQIADMLYLYGELRQSRRLASAIVKARTKEDITTIEQLLTIVRPLINPRQEKKELAQVFQALRIEVNGELSALRSMLAQALRMLAPGGRLAIITYHSLEDRLVKNFMKTGNFDGTDCRDFFGKSTAPMRLLTSRPITPDAAEIDANPRSRSAKLRIAEKL